MNNDLITVITVTYKNRIGLLNTLNSLSLCKCRPYEVIIVDGGSNDGTQEVVLDFKDRLSIKFISEKDDGIYYAMNKGLSNVQTPLVHYLNAGDLAVGDLYANCQQPGLFPVKILDPVVGESWVDKIKMSGFGYCHQGIVFPANHAPFNTKLKIAADFESICRTFKEGLNKLPVYSSGHVIYELGGISSVNSNDGSREIIAVACKLLDIYSSSKITLYITLKFFLPRKIRRLVSNFLSKWRGDNL